MCQVIVENFSLSFTNIKNLNDESVCIQVIGILDTSKIINLVSDVISQIEKGFKFIHIGLSSFNYEPEIIKEIISLQDLSLNRGSSCFLWCL